MDWGYTILPTLALQTPSFRSLHEGFIIQTWLIKPLAISDWTQTSDLALPPEVRSGAENFNTLIIPWSFSAPTLRPSRWLQPSVISLACKTLSTGETGPESKDKDQIYISHCITQTLPLVNLTTGIMPWGAVEGNSLAFRFYSCVLFQTICLI